MTPTRRDSRWTRAAAAALLCAALAGCASDDVQEEALHHYYKVVLLPVDVPSSVLPDQPPTEEELEADGGSDWIQSEGGPVPFALSRAELGNRIHAGLMESQVFSDVTAIDRAALRSENSDEWVAEASETARAEAADLILRVRVRSAEVNDLGPNSSRYWSSFMWVMIPAPYWPVDDRTYETNIAVQAELFDPDDPLRPKASVVASSGEQTLDMWDRGWKSDWRLLVVPPAFRQGDPRLVSEELTQRAVEQLLVQLRDQLRTNVIPSLFDVQVTLAAGQVIVSVTTPSTRKLRSLEVLADDQQLGAWAELGTEDIKQAGRSTETDFVYETQKLALGKAKVVRVIAIDETGGREVRTLRVGGRP